jgi:hypothetical protein
LTIIDTVKHFKLSIAGLIIEFTTDDTLNLTLPEYHQFLTNDGNPDIVIRVHYSPPPDFKLKIKPYEGNFSLNLFRSDDKLIITMSSPFHGSLPFRMVVIDANFRQGDLYIRPVPNAEELDLHSVTREKPITCPTEFLDRLLLILLLARGAGAIIHGCGVVVDGKGLLFTGISGAGKSTLANLWKKRKSASVIGDECIVVRQVDNHVWIYGTPWYSSAMTASPQGAPLKNIFFIKHGKKNYTRPLKPSDAAAALVAQSFSDYSEYSYVKYTLNLLSDITEEVPCIELEFVPDDEVIEYIIAYMTHSLSPEFK